MGIGTGTAAIIGGVSAAGSLGGAAISSAAGTKAANTESQAAIQAALIQKQQADEALAFQKQVYGDQQRNIAPWLQTGHSGLSNLAYLLGIGPRPGSAAGTASGMPSAGVAPTTGGNPSLPVAKQSIVGPHIGPDMNPANPPANNPTAASTPLIPPGSDALSGGQGGQAGLPFGAKGAAMSGLNVPLVGDTGTDTGGGGFGDVGNPTAIPPIVDTVGAGVPTGADGAPAAPAFDPSQPNTDLGGFGSLLQPWNQTFTAPTAATEQNDPGYQFRLAQGQKLLENSAASRGNLLSGATAKGLQQYGQDYASNEYGNVYNRALGQYQQNYNIFENNQANTFNRLAAIAGVGQTAANQLNSVGTSAAGNVGNILLTSGAQQGTALQNAAAARASGYQNAGNLFGSALGGAGSTLTNALLMQQLFGGGGGGFGLGTNPSIYGAVDPTATTY